MNKLPNFYQTRYVLFLDVLGFREIVREIETESDDGLRLFQIVREIIEEIGLETDVTNNVAFMQSDQPRYTQFSDSLVISTIGNVSGLKSILTRVIDLPMRLMKRGIFVRGAISKGLLWHDESHLMGGGLVDAYDMESKLARYPRVLVNDDVYQDAIKLIEPALKEWFQGICIKDVDGLHILAPFHPFYASGKDAHGPVFAEEHLSAVKMHIEKELARNARNMEVRAKYYWLARQINDIQRRCKERGEIARTCYIELEA